MHSNQKETYKILYIEDDEDDFLYLKTGLSISKRANFIVDWAPGEEEAFKKIKNEYDLFIIDYRLPTVDGITLMSKMKVQLQNNKPFIIFTGMKSQDIDEKALLRGAEDYLVKGGMETETIERTIVYCIERFKINNKLNDKNILLEMVIDSIPSAVFLLNKDGSIVMENKKAISLFSNFTDKNFYKLFSFSPYSENVFDSKVNNEINFFEIEEFPKTFEGVIELKDEIKLSCILTVNVIDKYGKGYRMISILDNTESYKEKEILRETNRSLETNLKKYGLSKKNPKAIMSLVETEIEKIMSIEGK
ncbi:response regulator [Candidatus Gracilibacteria bacterium]|nr:response regulator [Candidatus Gracilibacteria bacterium]